VGTDPRAVAIDPGTNVAVVANEGSDNVSVVGLGAIRSLHVLEVTPSTALSDPNPVNITVIGSGFSATSTVRLDESPLSTTFVNSRMLTATVPAASLASAQQFALDVVDGSALSNVTPFTVIQPIAVGTAPRAVAIDPERNIALVTNSGSNDISVVDLAAGNVAATIAVGTNPQGVAIHSRSSRAVVTNRGSNNVSIVDLATNTVAFTATVGTEPIGVAINPDTGIAVVANAGSSTVSTFAADSTSAPTVGNSTADQRPVAVAIDYTRNQALLLHTGISNNAATFDLATNTLSTRVSGIQFPTGAVYDPVTDRYIVAASLSNNLIIVTPGSTIPQSLRVGINPTSIAYNFNSATLVTVNTASQTMTVMDFIDRRVRAVIPITASPQLAIEIHPRTNIAVVADEANNRVLLVPLPR
jgi:YVTN family beta-propeller protein